jgi:hypothetical protein
MPQIQPRQPRRNRKPRRWIIPVALVVIGALVAGILYWVNRPTDPAAGSYRDIGGGVSVQDGAPEAVKAVVDEKIAKPPLKEVQALGDVVHVTPDGQQPKEITLRFKLNRKIDDPRDVVIAVNHTGKAEDWQLVSPTKVEGEYAYVTTNHLSWWEPLWRSFTDLVNATVTELKRQFDGLSGDAFAEAEKPKCKDEQAARDKGYSIAHKDAEVLYYCLGLDGGKPVVNVVNKRRYPIFVNHTGITVTNQPESKLGVEWLASQSFSGKRTVLLPFDQVGLGYELKKGESRSFDTEYNGFAEALYQLEFGVTTLLNILTRFGAGAGTISNGAIKIEQFDRVAEVMSKAVTIKDCANALREKTPNSGSILSGCFSPSALMDMFGWKGVLLATVMVVGPVINFFRNTFDTLGDVLLGKDKETITVGFNPPPPAPKVLFPGKWRVHGFNEYLVIDSSLTTTFSSNAGPCPKPDNEFNMCDEHVTIKFEVTGPDVMTGTYTKLWYTSEDGGSVPDDIYTEDGRTAGKTFTVKRNPDLPGDEHTLITYDGTGVRPGNPYLCDDYASQRNNTPKYQLCGA